MSKNYAASLNILIGLKQRHDSACYTRDLPTTMRVHAESEAYDTAIEAIKNVQTRETPCGSSLFFGDPMTGRRFRTCNVCNGKVAKSDVYCKHCGQRIHLHLFSERAGSE